MAAEELLSGSRPIECIAVSEACGIEEGEMGQLGKSKKGCCSAGGESRDEATRKVGAIPAERK